MHTTSYSRQWKFRSQVSIKIDQISQILTTSTPLLITNFSLEIHTWRHCQALKIKNVSVLSTELRTCWLYLLQRDKIPPQGVWFGSISTFVGYLMPHPVFTYVLNIWFVNTFFWIHTIKGSKSSISNNSIWHNSTKLIGSKYCYVSLTIQLNISHLFIHS